MKNTESVRIKSTTSDECFDFHDTKSNNNLLKNLQDIRLHDFYLKRKYEQLSHKIYKKLDKNLLTEFTEWFTNEKPEQIVFCDYGFSRAQGLTDVKIKVDERLMLGIQIQGEQYRKVVEVFKGEKVTAKDLENLERKFNWFNFSNFCDSQVYPKREKKVYNQYGDVFKYKYVKLGRDIKVSDLVNQVVNDVNTALDIQTKWSLK